MGCGVFSTSDGESVRSTADTTLVVMTVAETRNALLIRKIAFLDLNVIDSIAALPPRRRHRDASAVNSFRVTSKEVAER
jgi:hypothetical protein